VARDPCGPEQDPGGRREGGVGSGFDRVVGGRVVLPVGLGGVVAASLHCNLGRVPRAACLGSLLSIAASVSSIPEAKMQIFSPHFCRPRPRACNGGFRLKLEKKNEERGDGMGGKRDVTCARAAERRAAERASGRKAPNLKMRNTRCCARSTVFHCRGDRASVIDVREKHVRHRNKKTF
jgi:hypothetical protein